MYFKTNWQAASPFDGKRHTTTEQHHLHTVMSSEYVTRYILFLMENKKDTSHEP